MTGRLREVEKLMLDIVIRGGQVIDGTGAPARRADIGVKDGRIVAIGTIDEPAAEVIDAEGLMVAPGFIDPHTHYDANLFWDPEFTPSSRFGITSVIYGNCGYALAPVEGDALRYVIDAMSTVEQIPVEAIEHAVPWDWTTIDEY
ncbi:MAG: amidohydrolase family protein, partial [Actinomycetota bacterium]|nr:amidohydrolase family protein [Actinomycetota bacterium]